MVHDLKNKLSKTIVEVSGCKNSGFSTLATELVKEGLVNSYFFPSEILYARKTKVVKSRRKDDFGQYSTYRARRYCGNGVAVNTRWRVS